MVFLIKCLQVILALSILVILHEFGHYFWARLFHIRVEKFFLFFDFGGVKLFSTKTTKWFVKLFPKAAQAETEYGIGWFPLGGYCKISGMIDESMDTEQMKQEPKSWEFRTHPVWQRLLVMAGGVVNNFIFAILVYIAIMAIWGQSYISNRDSQIYVSELAYEMGFRNGDRILSMDGYVPESFGMLQADLVRRNVSRVSVLRGRDTLDLYIDRKYVGDMVNSPMMFDLAIPFVIDSVAAGSINRDAGLLRGDRVIAIGDSPVEFLQDSRTVLKEYAGREACASVIRGADTLAIPIQVDTAGRIGVFMKMPKVETMHYSFIQAIPAGFKLTGEMVSGYLKDLRMLATPSTGAYKSVGSFVAIGQIFPASWDWYQFMFILALLSIMLGVMNLIPIPGLDGGHIMFALYELFTGHKPSDRFLIIMQWIGMVFILGLMMLAFGNDIGRLIK